MKRKPAQYILLAIIVALVGSMGYLTLRGSSAQTPQTPATVMPATLTQAGIVEPETAGVVGNATVLDDTGASSGKSITFGDNTFGPQPANMPAGAITPEQFGAVGNGVNDDTAAVQAALNAGSGKVVWLSANKTYLCNKSLAVLSNGTLKGAGPTAVLLFTWTDNSQSASGKGIYLRNKLQKLPGDTNITLTNFVIKGAGSGMPSGLNADNPLGLPAALKLYMVDTFSVTHLEIMQSAGISFSYGSSNNGTIANNYVHNSGRDGITGFWGPDRNLTNISVMNNYITKVGDDGIAIVGTPLDAANTTAVPSGFTIRNNTIVGWASDPNGKMLGRGLVVQAATNVVVEQNSIINTPGAGILLVGCFGPYCGAGSLDPQTGQPWLSSNVRVLNNTIYNAARLPSANPGATYGGVYITTAKESTVTGNLIVNASNGNIRNFQCISCTVQAN